MSERPVSTTRPAGSKESLMSEFVGGICETCFTPCEVLKLDKDLSGVVECNSCRDYRLYYAGLTVEEQVREHEMMAAYVQETEERGDA